MAAEDAGAPFGNDGDVNFAGPVDAVVRERSEGVGFGGGGVFVAESDRELGGRGYAEKGWGGCAVHDRPETFLGRERVGEILGGGVGISGDGRQCCGRFWL